MLSFAELKMLGVCGFYLASNFFGFFLPLLGYLAYKGSWSCRALWGIVLADYAIPLRMPGIWMRWCLLTNDFLGKKSYFDAKVIMEGEFRKDRNYLICYHPHSLFGIGYNLMTTHLFEKYGIHTMFTGADIVRCLPLIRRVLTWWGFTPVSAGAMKKNLQRAWPENALMLMPGGISEMFYGLDDEQIILRKRKGFCKVALETGACLVPCYCMGANQVYKRVFGPRSVMARISSAIRTSLVLWTDRFGIPFGVVPRNTRMIMLIGKPIEVTKVAAPTKEQIEELHERYIEELRSMFDRHKAEMGPEWEKKELFLEDEDPSAPRHKRD